MHSVHVSVVTLGYLDSTGGLYVATILVFASGGLFVLCNLNGMSWPLQQSLSGLPSVRCILLYNHICLFYSKFPFGKEAFLYYGPIAGIQLISAVRTLRWVVCSGIHLSAYSSWPTEKRPPCIPRVSLLSQ